MKLQDICLNPRDKSLYLVFDYAEFDLFVCLREGGEKERRGDKERETREEGGEERVREGEERSEERSERRD